MNNEINPLVAFGIVLAVVLAIVGLFLPTIQGTQQLAGTSAAGSISNTDKGFGIAGWTPSNGATSTSIQNTTGQDVLVRGCTVQTENATTSFTAVTGTGLASFNIKAATTSDSGTPVVSNPNYVLNMNIATGTNAAGGTPFPQVLQATSTALTTIAGNASAFTFMVPNNAYLTFFSNATTSSTYSIFCPYLSN